MTAITMAPSPAPHDRPSFGSDLPPPSASASSAMLSPSAHRTAAASASASGTPSGPAYRSGSGSPRGHPGPAAAKSSPSSAPRNSDAAPKIIVKKEPGSPEPPTRRRPPPRELDLSKGGPPGAITPQTARPMTARDGLGIQEVGLACLSPGFVTHDPAMKEQLQRSMSVREQQRSIIEARLQQQSAKGDGDTMMKERDGPNQFAAKTPGFSRRKGAPAGLSIVAPSHENFANERVIQSAPLGQTFTGINNHPHPLTRHITNQPSRLSQTSHIHHVPAQQTNNRLPPIADVFGQGLSGHPESSGHASFAQQSAAHARGPMTSPGLPPPPPPLQMASTPGRPRDYKSAEEVQAEIAGGRPELLPKLVHYGGHQPPTPPSPHHHHSRPGMDSRNSSRRRTRAEYEEGASPPLGTGRAPQRRGPFGEGRDSPETQRAKKAEFLSLCDRAWDLFHS